jgi:hypothetical protein
VANDWPTGVTDAEEPEITRARPTGVAGTWTDGQSSIAIVESGSGVYHYGTTCDDAIRLIGDDTEATGEAPVRTYDSGGSCGSLIGYVTVTVEVGADPDTARLTMTQSPDDAGSWTCFSCGTSTLARVG